MKQQNTDQKRIGGVSSKALLIPVITVLAILHVLIISLIVSINLKSNQLSTIMRNSSSYISEATSLLAGSSLLSETSTNFVLMPTTETGETNLNPLVAYATELAATERRGDQIMADFRTYGVGEEILDILAEAAESADSMIVDQLHAIALMSDMYRLPNVPPFSELPIPELSETERECGNVQKVAMAKALVLGSRYAGNKSTVSKNVNLSVAHMREEANAMVEEASGQIAVLRHWLWAVTISIIVLLIIAFVLLHRMLLRPLLSFVHFIAKDEALDERKGLSEVRLVASAYNGLLKRRNALETLLRAAAETDTLTGISNRYGFEKYLLEAGESGYSLGIVLFDVNYLKLTNDTLGHAAGDRLIKSAAECITSCFGTGAECCCSRFGGDEFAAAIKGVSAAEMQQMVERFKLDQKERDLSIAWGWAHTGDIGATTVKALMDEADKHLYEQKKYMHEHDGLPKALREKK